MAKPIMVEMGRGITEDPLRCAVEVADSSGWHFYQCSRKRGHGTGGLYCKQHAKRHDAKAAEGEPGAEPHKFVSEYGSEFCDVCGRSCIGHSEPGAER